MNYFLKRHKLVAWVVMLTFLFSMVMPTNLGMGNAASAATNETLNYTSVEYWYNDGSTTPAATNGYVKNASKTQVLTSYTTDEALYDLVEAGETNQDTYVYVGKAVDGQTLKLYYADAAKYINVTKTLENLTLEGVEDGTPGTGGEGQESGSSTDITPGNTYENFTLKFTVGANDFPQIPSAGQNITLVIDKSLSMGAAAGPNTYTTNTGAKLAAHTFDDTAAVKYEDTRWYALTQALDSFLDTVLADGSKNTVTIIAFNTSAETIVRDNGNRNDVKDSYKGYLTKDEFNNNNQKKGDDVNYANEDENGNSIEWNNSYYPGTKNPYMDVDGLYKNQGKTLGSGTNIGEGLRYAANNLPTNKNTTVILLTDGIPNKPDSVADKVQYAEDEGKALAEKKVSKGGTVNAIYTIGFGINYSPKALGSGTYADGFYEPGSADGLKELFKNLADSITELQTTGDVTITDGIGDSFTVEGTTVDTEGNVVITAEPIVSGTDAKTYKITITPDPDTKPAGAVATNNGYSLTCTVQGKTEGSKNGSSAHNKAITITKEDKSIEDPTAYLAAQPVNDEYTFYKAEKGNDEKYSYTGTATEEIAANSGITANDPTQDSLSLRQGVTVTDFGIKEQTLVNEKGTLHINADGTFEFTPKDDTATEATFTYEFVTQYTTGNLPKNEQIWDKETTTKPYPEVITLVKTANVVIHVKDCSITFTKRDASGNKAPLAGAIFGLYNKEACGEKDLLKQETSADQTGNVVFSNLTPGTYYVKEISAPAGYIADTTVYTVQVTAENPNPKVNNGVIVNIPTTDVTVTKVWDDNDNQDNVRPTSVNVQVMNGTENAGEVTLNADNSWTAEVTGLPATTADGTVISYTVQELKADGKTPVGSDKKYNDDYTVSYGTKDLTTEDGTTITALAVTNTHHPEKISIPVTKVWEDNSDANKVRPNRVTFKLQKMVDGSWVDVTDKTVTLTATRNAVATTANTWSGSFTNLPKYESGQEIQYNVAEISVAGYTTAKTGDAEKGFTFTNTLDATAGSYVVEYYYRQPDGSFTKEIEKDEEGKQVVRKAALGATVTVENADKVPTLEDHTYVLMSDKDKSANWSGTIPTNKTAAEEPTVLEVYFDMQLQVNYIWKNADNEVSKQAGQKDILFGDLITTSANKAPNAQVTPDNPWYAFDGKWYAVPTGSALDFDFETVTEQELHENHEWNMDADYLNADNIATYVTGDVLNLYAMWNAKPIVSNGMINLTKQVTGDSSKATTKTFEFKLTMSIDSEKTEEETELQSLRQAVKAAQVQLSEAVDDFKEFCEALVEGFVPSTGGAELLKAEEPEKVEEPASTEETEKVETPAEKAEEKVVTTTDDSEKKELTTEESEEEVVEDSEEVVGLSEEAEEDSVQGYTEKTRSEVIERSEHPANMLEDIEVYSEGEDEDPVTMDDLVQVLAGWIVNGDCTNEEAVAALQSMLNLVFAAEDMSDAEKVEAAATISELANALTIPEELPEDDSMAMAKAFLYAAAVEVLDAYEDYMDAQEAYEEYLDIFESEAEKVTPSAIQLVLTYSDGTVTTVKLEKGDDGNYTYEGILLENGQSVAIDVEATTGSAISFKIEETVNGDADRVDTKVGDGEVRQGIGTVRGTVTENMNLLYTFINYFEPTDNPPDPRDPEDPKEKEEKPPVVPIDDPEVPQGEPEEPVVEPIDEPDVPLVDVPGEEVTEVVDTPVPLGDAPAMGDSSNAMAFALAMLAAGLGLVVTRRKFN